MNFITNGLQWLSDQRDLNCSEEVLIGLSLDRAETINATVTQSKAPTTQNRVTQQKQVFHFVVKRSDFVTLGVPMQRGLQIWYNDDRYELIYDKMLYEYNDPAKLDLVLQAVLWEESDGLRPISSTC